MIAFIGVTSQCEEHGFRRSAGTNFEIAIAVVPAGTKCFSLLRKTTGRWSVNYAFSLPHWNSVPSTQMQQNNSELAGDSDLGLLDADAFGQPHTPSFQD